MSHTVILEITLKPGLGAAVIPGLLTSLVDTRAYAGAGLIEAYVDSDNPDRVVIWEKWESRPHQEAYLNWRVETGMIESLADVIAEPPRFTHLTAAE
jgi:quinol monooxygenase YgiN